MYRHQGQLGQPSSSTEALRSVHTSNLPELFKQLQISLVVSTYQAGKVILIRNDQGYLNTHFRAFAKPMGIAVDGARLTIGGTNTVWYYRNVPAVAQKLEPAGKYDGCYLPRRIHVTGGQRGEKGRSPVGGETMVGIERAEAAKAGIHYPKSILVVPGQFVDIDVDRKIAAT